MEVLKTESIIDLSKNEPTVVHVFIKLVEMHKEFDFINVAFIDDVKKYYPKANQELIDQQNRGISEIKLFLKEGMKQGVIKEDLNIEVVAFLLQDSNRTIMNTINLTNNSFSNWELFFTTMINFIRGISTADGIEIVDTFLTKHYSNINV